MYINNWIYNKIYGNITAFNLINSSKELKFNCLIVEGDC